jgi:type IV secretory pathway VirB2 component (pilin)
VTATHKECRNNACVIIPGVGTDQCANDAACARGGGGTSTQNFEILNPIGIDSFQDLVNVIGRWIFNLAIPIAVIIIIYAGVLMLTSGGDPGRFKNGRQALLYAVLGLAVVLIGKGFVTLIQSILSLRNP